MRALKREACGNFQGLVDVYTRTVTQYLDEIIHVLPYWLRDRCLELSLKAWTATRARLSADELKKPVGHITVPAPASASASA